MVYWKYITKGLIIDTCKWVIIVSILCTYKSWNFSFPSFPSLIFSGDINYIGSAKYKYVAVVTEYSSVKQFDAVILVKIGWKPKMRVTDQDESPWGDL